MIQVCIIAFLIVFVQNPAFCKKKKHCISTMLFGAVDGARTRNIQLGKLTLYH